MKLCLIPRVPSSSAYETELLKLVTLKLKSTGLWAVESQQQVVVVAAAPVVRPSDLLAAIPAWDSAVLVPLAT